MKTQADIRTAYDEWSKVYDTDLNPLVAIDDTITPSLFPELRDKDVLDVGCGTGRHTVRLVERGARVVGVDTSAGMLDAARSKIGDRASFKLVEPGQSLPFAPASFDVVVCTLVVEHEEDLLRPIKEIARVLRIDGVAILSDIHPAMRAMTQANFTNSDGVDVLPPSFPHPLEDWVIAAGAAGLRIDALAEHDGTESLVDLTPRAKKYVGVPMLVTMRATRRAP